MPCIVYNKEITLFSIFIDKASEFMSQLRLRSLVGNLYLLGPEVVFVSEDGLEIDDLPKILALLNVDMRIEYASNLLIDVQITIQPREK